MKYWLYSIKFLWIMKAIGAFVLPKSLLLQDALKANLRSGCNMLGDAINKHDFHSFSSKMALSRDLIYLDSAATSQQPISVSNAISNYVLNSHSNVHRGGHFLATKATESFETARSTVQHYLNAELPAEIVFTSGATHAINLVAFGWARSRLKPGDEIVLSVMEHHSNIVPWQVVARETGAIIRYVQLNSAMELDVNHFSSLLSPHTKVVSICHVSNVLGVTNPIHELTPMIRAANPNAIIVVDACQSSPHQRLDAQVLDVDFICFSGHKMCGPTGIGVLYGKYERLDEIVPLCVGGGMTNNVDISLSNPSTFHSLPYRLEAGTPAIAQAVGLAAAIEYLNGIGFPRIQDHCMLLGQHLRDQLARLPGCLVLGPPSASTGIVSFVHEKVHPNDIATLLDTYGVAVRAGQQCAQPLHRALLGDRAAQWGSIRASAYLYNSISDIDRFMILVEESIAFFDK